MLLEARTGHSWGQDFSERFFTPLGMSRTRYCATNVPIPGRASGYSKNGAGPWMNATYLAMSHTFGLAFDPTLRITFTMVDGKPTKVTLKQGGGTFEGVRRP